MKISRKAVQAALKAHVSVLKGDPLKPALKQALVQAGNLGGQERRFAAFAARELSRHQRLLDFFARRAGQAPSKLGLTEDQAIARYALWRVGIMKAEPARVLAEVRLPGPLRPRSLSDAALQQLVERSAGVDASHAEDLPTRHSLPGWLFEELARSVPAGPLEPLLQALNVDPPLVLRARPPGTGAELAASLTSQGIPASPHPWAPDALVLEAEDRRVFDAPEFRANRLQVQDLGSQLIVELCRPRTGFEGAWVADLCAGAGGKALALADRVGPGGSVLAYDRSGRRLQEAKARARRFGLGQIRFPADPGLATAKLALLDAPCSGSGALAREPDQKWRLDRPGWEKLRAVQRELLDSAAARLPPGGTLVYATCSLLVGENEEQVEAFLNRHPRWRLVDAADFVPPSQARSGPFLRIWPHRAVGAGFFAARLEAPSQG